MPGRRGEGEERGPTRTGRTRDFDDLDDGAGGAGERYERVPAYPDPEREIESSGEKSRSTWGARQELVDSASSSPRSGAGGGASKENVEKWRTEQSTGWETATETSLVGRSDAEIGKLRLRGSLPERVSRLTTDSTEHTAQHHFRLAQQHLEAAQRLAMAASHAPDPAAPSVSPSLDRRRADDLSPHLSHSSGSSTPDSDGVLARDALHSEFGQLCLDSNDDSKHGAAASSPSPRSTFPYGQTSTPTNPKFATLPQSTPRRSSVTSNDQATPRPARRPSAARVAPASTTDGHTAAEMDGSRMVVPTLVPSLYGGTLPTPPQSSHSSDCDAFEYDSILGVDDDDDDERGSTIMSEYHEAQSTLSHATTTPLPPYEYERWSSQHAIRSSPVIQPRYADEYEQASRRGFEAEAFHGFRPRLAPVAPYPITESSRWVPQMTADQTFAPPPPPPQQQQLQPHSYILGTDGRPIPVYASVPTPAPSLSSTAGSYSLPHPSRPPPPSTGRSSSSLATRPMLAIHSQPLEFDHSIHHGNSTNIGTNRHQSLGRAMTRASDLSMTAQDAFPSPSLSVPRVASRRLGGEVRSNAIARATATTTPHHAYHLPPPSTFSAPTIAPRVAFPNAATSVPLIVESTLSDEHSPTPSASSHASSSSPHDFGLLRPKSPSERSSFRMRLTSSSSSLSLSSTGRSLRRMVKSPHVRFKSPEPSIAESSAAETRLVDAAALDQTTTDERNHNAMKQSLSMLM